MFVGPVLSAELVTSARRGRFFLWRVLYAGLLLAVLVIVYLINFGLAGADSIQAAADYARNFFDSFAFVQLLAVLLLGPALAAGSIARERERRTIEYLFTTHLTDTEIIVHKLLAAVLQMILAVLVGLPILALAMLLGGISLAALLAVALVTISTVVAVAVISLSASVVARRVREAVVASYLVLTLLLLGPPLLQSLFRGSAALGWLALALESLNTVNPFQVLYKVLDTSTTATSTLDSAGPRWIAIRTMLVLHGTLALAGIAFCIAALRRAGSDSPTVANRRASKRPRWSAALCDFSIAWKEMFTGRSDRRLARLSRGAVALLIVLAIGAAAWRYYLAASSGKFSDYGWFQVWFAALLGCGMLLLVAVAAANSISAERETDTWLTLMSTPVTAREVLLGKVLGSLYAARGAALPLLVVWTLSAIAVPRTLVGLPLTTSALALLCLASSLVGVGFSLWCQNTTRALGATLATGMGAVVLGTCCLFPLGTINPVYLLVFPAIVSQSAWEIPLQQPGMLMGIVMMAGMYGLMWIAGMVLYGILAWALWATLVRSFDRLAGRTAEGTLPVRR